MNYGTPALDSSGIDSILSLIGDVTSSSVTWFTDIMEKTGMLPLFMGMFVITLCIKYLLAPVLGSAGSDKVKRKKDDSDE